MPPTTLNSEEPFMYVCVGTLILSATTARLLTLGARAANHA